MRIARIVLLGFTVAASAWAAVLTFAGGVAIHAPWGRLSSRDPVRPLALAFLAAVAYALATRLWYPGIADGTRSDAARWPRRLALAFAVVACLAGVRFATFSASGSDPSGYVSEAALWREGHLTRPAPEWVAAAPWPDAARTASPLGYRPGATSATQVPAYPAGLPLLMALAHALAGTDGEYYVVPISGAILLWAAYLLGARLASPWGGLAAAALLASSPPFLMWLVMPMGDLPVAACWTLALVGALSGGVNGATAAGAATALAILIRPNLVPLALPAAFVVFAVAGPGRLRRLLAYGVTAAAGPTAVAAINWSVYGSPFQSGYGNLEALYSLAFVWPNVQRYTRWFVSAQTVVPLLGLIAPFLDRQRCPRAIVVAIAGGVPALALVLYLPYTRFEDWSYLRFLLPAYPALFAGLAIVLWNSAERWNRRRWVGPVLALAVGLLALRGLDYSNAATDLSRTEPRYRTAAMAAAAAPAKTVFVSFQHSGSLRYYTGRDILRWDLMDATSIDRAIDYLQGLGYRVCWVGDPVEVETVTQRFAGTRFLARMAAGVTRRVDGVELIDLGARSMD